MNDPHVVALLYQIDHGRSVDYRDAKPIDREEEGFCVKVENERVRFEFKKHYATEDAARKAIEDYIRAWEFSAGLREGPNYFKLKFDRAQIEDRNPTPGAKNLSVHARSGAPTATATLTVLPRCYPPPPLRLKITPDVQTMYDRYMGYLQGREPLPGMAYFCLTVLEISVSQCDQQPGRKRRKQAAEKFRIEPKVLCKIGELSSKRGSSNEARKAYCSPTDLDPLTEVERCFLKEVIRRIICRVAKTEYGPVQELPKIKLSDFKAAVSPE